MFIFFLLLWQLSLFLVVFPRSLVVDNAEVGMWLFSTRLRPLQAFFEALLATFIGDLLGFPFLVVCITVFLVFVLLRLFVVVFVGIKEVLSCWLPVLCFFPYEGRGACIKTSF